MPHRRRGQFCRAEVARDPLQGGAVLPDGRHEQLLCAEVARDSLQGAASLVAYDVPANRADAPGGPLR